VLVTVAAIVGETDAEADALALPALLSRLRRLRGISAPLPSLEEARAYPWTERERAEVAASRNMIVGSPATVRARLETLVRAYAADELMVVTIAPDYASRMRSYELLAAAWRDAGPAAEGAFGNAVARASG
jgi:alkanesulfonate monooxygenase SsuD/methylene tetrahydromethanopterin reductase-like flavin-dependent oxidoreductase (luciferase family)